MGFRPFVSRGAARCGILGSVANRGSYVEIFAQGTQRQLDGFLEILRQEAPERSTILKIDIQETDLPEQTAFSIIESEKETGISSSPRISPPVPCVKRNCLTKQTGGITTRLSTVPPAVRD